MALSNPDVPSWPIAEAAVDADGSARLRSTTTSGRSTRPDSSAARAEVVQLVRRDLAEKLARPVRLRTLDPDGSEGLLAAAPDGSISELAPREQRTRLAPPPRPRRAPAAPPVHAAEPESHRRAAATRPSTSTTPAGRRGRSGARKSTTARPARFSAPGAG